MNRQFAIGLSFALLTTLAACGGGGSSDVTSPTPPPTGGSTTTAKVAGPLDAIQTPITNQIIAPLASAVAGTPLQGVLICANHLVVEQALDAIDSAALAIQSTDPTALASANTAANLQNQLQNMAVNLQGLLASMSGDITACIALDAPTGGNPLAGTPLAAVGAQLAPVLAQIYNATSGAGTGSRPSLPLSTLTQLYAQLNSAVQSAFAQIPASVSGAPVLGGVITAVKTSTAQVNNLVIATVIAASGGSTSGVQTVIATSVNTLLKSVLIGIVPVSAIETQGGHAGLLSGPIASAIDTITLQLGSGNIDSLSPTTLQALLTSTTASVINPEQSAILSKLTGPLTAALAGVSVPGNDPLAPLTSALMGFLNGSAGSSPLALITSTIEQIVGLGGACPTANTPLAFLCTLHLGLPLGL